MNQFSVILPVRNGGEYIKQAVKSVLAQTYTAFELIILIHDCEDATIQWLQDLQDARIKIHNQNNVAGIVGNWSRILTVPKQEYMTIIGYDDILYPDFLEQINQLITQHPTASLYHTHFNYIDADEKTIRACKPMPASISKEKYIEMFLTHALDSMATGYVCRSKDYEAVGGIPTHYPNLLYADHELWYNITALGYKVIAAKTCFAFRLHQSTTSISGNTTMWKALDTFIHFLHQQTDAAVKKVIENKALTFVKFCCKTYSHRLIKTLPTKRVKEETVKNYISLCNSWLQKLLPNSKYKLTSDWQVKMAVIIDSNIVFKKLFLLFKQVVNKPVIKH